MNTLAMRRSALERLVTFVTTLLVNTGRAIISGRMYGTTPSQVQPIYIGWGTGAGTTGASDTTLFTEKDVDLSTGSGTRTTGSGAQSTGSTTNDTFLLTGTRTATGAGSVTNAGAFDNATIASGNLFIKGDFTSIGLSIGDSIAFSISARFS